MVGFTGLCALNSFLVTLIRIFYTGYHLAVQGYWRRVHGSGRSTRYEPFGQEERGIFGFFGVPRVEVSQAWSALAQQSCRIPGRMRLPSLLIFPKSLVFPPSPSSLVLLSSSYWIRLVMAQDNPNITSTYLQRGEESLQMHMHIIYLTPIHYAFLTLINFNIYYPQHHLSYTRHKSD